MVHLREQTAQRTGQDRGIEEVLQLWQQIREDWETNKRDWTEPGFRALVMYRFGVWRTEIGTSSWRGKLARKLANRLYQSMHRYVRNLYGIELHSSARIGRRVRIAHQGAIVIHRFAQIGDRCVIRQGVTLGNAGRGVTREEAPTLGNDVSLGAGAVILGRVTVGDGARIGPNTVIMSDVPAGATVFASPPRMIYSLAPPTASKVEDQSLSGSA